MLVGYAFLSELPVHVYTDDYSLGNGRDDTHEGAGRCTVDLEQTEILMRAFPMHRRTVERRFTMQSCPLSRAQPCCPLSMYSDSEYAIRSLTERTLRDTASNWSCHNGDLLRDCLSLIQGRAATPYKFQHVDAHMAVLKLTVQTPKPRRCGSSPRAPVRSPGYQVKCARPPRSAVWPRVGCPQSHIFYPERQGRCQDEQ